MEAPLRVLVVDDHTMTFAGLQQVLDDNQYVLMAEQAVSCAQMWDLCETHLPEVLVLALKLAKPYPDAVIGRLRQDFPAMRIVLIDDGNDDARQLLLMSLGNMSILRQGDPLAVWQNCFRVVARGGIYIGQSLLGRSDTDQPAPNCFAPAELSEREAQLLRLMTQGYTNQETAETLSLSAATVRNNLTGLYQKLGVKNRQQAVAWGIQANM